MAITEDELAVTTASPGTIDGIELTPKTVGLDGIPSFDDVEDERHYRKTHLALSLIHISEPTRPELVSRMPSSA